MEAPAQIVPMQGDQPSPLPMPISLGNSDDIMKTKCQVKSCNVLVFRTSNKFPGCSHRSLDVTYMKKNDNIMLTTSCWMVCIHGTYSGCYHLHSSTPLLLDPGHYAFVGNIRSTEMPCTNRLEKPRGFHLKDLFRTCKTWKGIDQRSFWITFKTFPRSSLAEPTFVFSPCTSHHSR